MTKKYKAFWCRWVPGDFIAGIRGMSLEEVGLYTIILNMIYDQNGPIADDVKRMARIVGERPTSLEKKLQQLVALGKIMRIDGVISNSRAEKEIENQSKKIEKLLKNLSSGKEKPVEKSNKINGATMPFGQPSEAQMGAEKLEARSYKLEKKEKDRRSAAKPRPAGTPPQSRRIDPGLKPSNANIVFAKSRGLTHKESNFEWEKFVRYYRGLSGKNSTSPDWDAVWESWVLRATERLGRDSFVGETTSNGHHSLEDFTREDWTQIISVWRLTNNWSPNHGPAPGRPGCKVPSDLVTTN